LSTTLPIEALSEAELIEESHKNPHALLQASLDAAGVTGEPVSYINTIVPLFSTVMYDDFRTLIDRRTAFRVVYDADTYEQLHQARNMIYLGVSLLHPAIETRVYSESLNFGVATYDDTVMIAGYTDPSAHAVGTVSHHPALVEWANDLVDEYWNRAESPSARVRESVRRFTGMGA
jgi:hypothetical protein